MQLTRSRRIGFYTTARLLSGAALLLMLNGYPAQAQDEASFDTEVAVEAGSVKEEAPAVVAPASTAPSTALVSEEFISYLRTFGMEDVFQIVLGVCNENTKDVVDSDYEGLDAEWVRQSKEKEQPVIARALTNPLSLRVTQIQAQHDGLFLEVFVMDGKGLNCGQSAVTSDYWQGDEAKWKKTYAVGPDAVFIDEVEFNDDLGVWAVQVNMTIKDKQSGMAIGSATYEVNLTELERRVKQGIKLF